MIPKCFSIPSPTPTHADYSCTAVCQEPKRKLTFHLFLCNVWPSNISGRERRAVRLLTTPPLQPLHFHFCSPWRKTSQEPQKPTKLTVLYVCFPPWKEQASYCFPKSRFMKGVSLFLYNIHNNSFFYCLLSSCTTPKIMEEGKEKTKLFGVILTFPFFLKVSFNVCENSSLTVEDIHYWQII